MKRLFPSIPEAVERLGIVFLAFLVVVLLLYSVIPDQLKDHEYHIRTTVEREQQKSIRFIGSTQCNECHEQAQVKSTGPHRMLSCETCHGPGFDHQQNPAEVKPRSPRQRDGCGDCHDYNSSRPTGFPQINPAMHNPIKACIECHNPHNPRPSEVIQECQACHAEIARTKSVSPHSQVPCIVCHEAPRGHLTNPRVVLVSKPTEREFCAKCHGKNAKTKSGPVVDFSTHGEKYLCWQCHYPHMPEIEL